MNKFSPMGGGSPEKENKKKIAIFAIAATAALIALLLVVLAVVGIVSAIKNKNSDDDGEGDGGVSTAYTTKEVSESEIHLGYLQLLDETSVQKTAAELVQIATLRPKNDSNKPIYYMDDMTNFYADEEALTAFNTMMTAYYKSLCDAAAAQEAETPADTNIDIVKALKPNVENFDPEYRLGTTFALHYYTEQKNDAGNLITAPINESIAEHKWIYENCAKYGFAVRYPATSQSAETGEGGQTTANGSYIFRYVGVAHATYMTQKKLSLDAYVDFLINNTKAGSKAITISGADGKKYQVYYAVREGENGEILVPSSYTYSYSGDNKEGFIVTVNSSERVAKKTAETN